MAINKMDDPSVAGPNGEWSKARYDDIESKLTPFLRGCGYNPKKDLIYLPISGLMGLNMKEKVAPATCQWYTVRPMLRGVCVWRRLAHGMITTMSSPFLSCTVGWAEQAQREARTQRQAHHGPRNVAPSQPHLQGPTFFEVLDNIDPQTRDPYAPFRMPIIDRYRQEQDACTRLLGTSRRGVGRCWAASSRAEASSVSLCHLSWCQQPKRQRWACAGTWARW